MAYSINFHLNIYKAFKFFIKHFTTSIMPQKISIEQNLIVK